MKIAVVGMTQFGRSLALKLTQLGAEVIAIDSNEERIEQIKNDVSMSVVMDASEDRELRNQGIHEADALACCFDTNFEANLLVVICAKRIGIKRIICRTSTATHAQILKQVGADIVVLPEADAAEDLGRRLLMPALENYFQLLEGYGVAEIATPRAFQGRSIGDMRIADEYRVNLVAVRRRDASNPRVLRVNVLPKPADVLQAGDTLTLVGSDANLRRIADLPS